MFVNQGELGFKLEGTSYIVWECLGPQIFCFQHFLGRCFLELFECLFGNFLGQSLWATATAKGRSWGGGEVPLAWFSWQILKTCADYGWDDEDPDPWGFHLEQVGYLPWNEERKAKGQNLKRMYLPSINLSVVSSVFEVPFWFQDRVPLERNIRMWSCNHIVGKKTIEQMWPNKWTKLQYEISGKHIHVGIIDTAKGKVRLSSKIIRKCIVRPLKTLDMVILWCGVNETDLVFSC